MQSQAIRSSHNGLSKTVFNPAARYQGVLTQRWRTALEAVFYHLEYRSCLHT